MTVKATHILKRIEKLHLNEQNNDNNYNNTLCSYNKKNDDKRYVITVQEIASMLRLCKE